jgi:predicted phosphodiesterase
MPILTAILSDIHGNLPALEAVLDDMKDAGVDRIISLGDVSGYYPFINEVITLLREHEVTNLIGNHDRYIIDNTECPRSTSANAALTYQKSVLTSQSRQWLAQSVASLKIGDASMVHGGWNDPEDEYLYKIDPAYFQGRDGRFFFCGHTHVQIHLPLDEGKSFTNPGSVGQPRDGNPDAAYCLFDETCGCVELRRVSYDINRVAARMEALGFDEKFYTNLYGGTRIGGRIDRIEWQDPTKMI